MGPHSYLVPADAVGVVGADGSDVGGAAVGAADAVEFDAVATCKHCTYL